MTVRNEKAERLAYTVTVIVCTAIVVGGTLALYFSAEIFGYDSGLPLWLLGPGVLVSAVTCLWTGWLLGSERTAKSFGERPHPTGRLDLAVGGVLGSVLDIALGAVCLLVGFGWWALGENAPALQLPLWVPPAFFLFIGSMFTLSGILRLVMRRMLSRAANENPGELVQRERG